jgi:hypothetical protein
MRGVVAQLRAVERVRETTPISALQQAGKAGKISAEKSTERESGLTVGRREN